MLLMIIIDRNKKVKKNISTRLVFQRCWKLSINSERMTHPEPPSTSSRVILPPGTSSGSFTDEDEFEFLSDQDIAAGITPKSTNTTSKFKQWEKTCLVKIGFQETTIFVFKRQNYSWGSYTNLKFWIGHFFIFSPSELVL